MARIPLTRAALATCLLLAFCVAPPAIAADLAYEQQIICEDDAERGGKVCKVDKKTYIGWRTFSSNCLRCHGQDAVGSTFAPSLVERMREIDKQRFMNSVANGFKGQVGIMPPWKDNPNVTKRYEELYGYLSARADGRLLAGRPKRVDR
jgi:mono/diheme cytochrome c family protein